MRLLSDRHGDRSGMNRWNRVQHCSSAPIPFTLFLLRLIGIFQLKQKHAVCRRIPAFCFCYFILLNSYFSRSFFLHRSRWDKKDTSSQSSLVLELLLAYPSLSSHSSFWALGHSSSPSSLSQAGSFICRVSLIHSPIPTLGTGEVCGTEAGIIDRASV